MIWVRIIWFWLMGVVGIGLIFCACTQSAKPAEPTEMSLDQAILLTKGWCNKTRESFDKATVSPNGDFRGVFGAPEFIYSSRDKQLSVEGLIINDATVIAKYPELFQHFERTGNRELYMLGEGHFYIERTPMGKQAPQLTLRKDFVDGSISPVQFVKEVNWLMRWSTYWRLQRGHTVFGAPEDQLIKEAPEIEAKFRKSSPRPW